MGVALWNECLVGLGYRKGSSNVGASAILWRRKRRQTHTNNRFSKEP